MYIKSCPIIARLDYHRQQTRPSWPGERQGRRIWEVLGRRGEDGMFTYKGPGEGAGYVGEENEELPMENEAAG